MKERQIQTEFSKVIDRPGVYELKLAKGSSLPYSSVADHQIESLWDVWSGKGFFYKIGDNPVFAGMNTRFHAKKPFDCFYLKSYPAYVGICYYKPRQKRSVLCINIQIFSHSRESDTRKSLTEERAKEIAEFEINL